MDCGRYDYIDGSDGQIAQHVDKRRKPHSDKHPTKVPLFTGAHTSEYAFGYMN